MVLKAVGGANGYEAYRQLICANEPHSKNRSMSLLNLIMNWPSFSNKTSLLSQVMKLENAYAEYERLGTALAEEIRTAVLMRCITGQLKVWLQLQITETTSYNQLRELVVSYERSTARWTESMVLGAEVPDSSAPMEVDRIQKGKGAGKKGQGKKGENQKGAYNSFKGQSKSDFKGRGKYDKGKGKSKNSKSNDGKGHDRKGHGKYWSEHSKGKGYGQGKSRGDGGKGNQQSIQCWHCGGNHKAANCWKNNHVRQVCDEQDTTSQQLSEIS